MSKPLRKFTFDSLEAFVAEAQKPTHPVYGDGAGRRPGEKEFFGTSSFDETLKMAREGWPEGRKLFVNAMASAAPVTARVADFTMDVAGAYPIAALAAAGDPAAMVDFNPDIDRVRPIIRLALNRCASAAYSAKELTNYGAAVASYVDAIEASGYRVEIDAAMVCLDGKSRPYYCGVIVKQAHEPMEIDRMAFCLASPSYLRRLHFQVAQNREDDENSMDWCGSPMNISPEHVEHGVLVVPGINVFKPGSKQLNTAEAAATALQPIIKNVLSAAGVNPPALAFGGQALA
jgi:hypothetical protein